MFVIVLVFGANFLSDTMTGMAVGDVLTQTAEASNAVGLGPSIALDSDGKVHAAHYDITNDYLRYCNNTQGSWTCDAVTYTDLLAAPDDLSTSAIAIDSNDKVHIALYYYVNAGDRGLKYCNNTIGSWTCQAIETANVVGYYTSIAIDSNDKIHISHYDSTNTALRYCNNTIGSWTCQAVETTNAVGGYTSIAIDSNDKVHISHQDGNSNYDLRYCNNTAGAWTCQAIETANNVGFSTSIAIDGNDKIHISHYDSTNTALRYCNNTAGAWTCGVADNSAAVGGDSSIALDRNNKVHISHLQYVTYRLRYCNNTIGTWSCDSLATSEMYSYIDAYTRIAIKQGRIVDSTSFSGAAHIVWYSGRDLKNLMYTNISYTEGDVISPTVTLHNLTYEYPNNVSVLFNFTDETETDSFSINDTTNFEINKTGFLFNKTVLTPDISFRRYWLTVTVNDSSNNTASADIWINITDTTLPNSATDLSAPYIGTNWIYWEWTNSTSSDLNYTIVYLNSTWQTNTTNTNINTTGLSLGTTYTLTLHTIDIRNNLNNSDVNYSAITQTTTTILTTTTESPGSGYTPTTETTEETIVETTETIMTETTLEIIDDGEEIENIIDNILEVIISIIDEKPQSVLRIIDLTDDSSITDFKSVDFKGIDKMILACSESEILNVDVSEFDQYIREGFNYVDDVNCEKKVICRWIKEMQKKNVTEECRLITISADGDVTEKAFDMGKIGHPEKTGLIGEKIIFGIRLSKNWFWLFIPLAILIYLIVKYLKSELEKTKHKTKRKASKRKKKIKE